MLTVCWPHHPPHPSRKTNATNSFGWNSDFDDSTTLAFVCRIIVFRRRSCWTLSNPCPWPCPLRWRISLSCRSAYERISMMWWDSWIHCIRVCCCKWTSSISCFRRTNYFDCRWAFSAESRWVKWNRTISHYRTSLMAHLGIFPNPIYCIAARMEWMRRSLQIQSMQNLFTNSGLHGGGLRQSNSTWSSQYSDMELVLAVSLNSLRLSDASLASWSIVVSQSLAGLCCWFIVWLKYGFRRSSISLGNVGGSDNSVWHIPSRVVFGKWYGSPDKIIFWFLSGQSTGLGTILYRFGQTNQIRSRLLD